MSVSFRGAVLLPSGCLACIFNLVLRCSKSGQFSRESAAPHNQPARLAGAVLLCPFLFLHLLVVLPAYFELVVLNYILGFAII